MISFLNCHHDHHKARASSGGAPFRDAEASARCLRQERQMQTPDTPQKITCIHSIVASS